MKLTRILKVTEKEFYDFLEDSLLSDIYQWTSKELSVDNIKKGLKYSKHDQDTFTRIDISISDYKRGTSYKSEIKSMSDTITISYETEAVADGLKIVFIQTFESFEKGKHNKLMKMFSEAVYYGRMSDNLFDIQNKIIKKRKGIPENAPSKK